MFSYGGISPHIYANRLKAEGMGSYEQAVHFQNQVFDDIKQECQDMGYLFEDPCFPAEPPSLGFKELGPYSSKTSGVEWKRPTVGERDQSSFALYFSDELGSLLAGPFMLK